MVNSERIRLMRLIRENVRKVLSEDDEAVRFKPTTEWMEKSYKYLNDWLFNGSLGGCILRPFTTGKGSQGRTLGWFKMTANGLLAERYSRRIYKNASPLKIFLNKDNFAEVAKPCIELNANYSWTEDDMLATLAHEMCHYYVYMQGYLPKQGHGREFREIGSVVSRRSGGKFTIQRLASAEQMSNMVLDDDVAERNERRVERKKSSMVLMFVFMKNGEIQLTTTSSQAVLDKTRDYHMSPRNIDSVKLIITTNDKELVDIVYKNGYKKNFRTSRYYNVEGRPFAYDILKYPHETVYTSNGDGNGGEMGLVSENALNRKRRSDDILITPDMNLGVMVPD